MVLGSGAVLTAKNGSDLRLGNTTVKKAARVSVLSGSIISTSGYIDADSSVGTLLAVDNATWNASGDLSLKNTATNLLSNGATVKCNNLNINGANTLISIDNAALLVKGAANLGTATPGGGRIVFKGDNPMLKSISGSEFKDSVNNANMTSHLDFDFVVPEGGFAAPPIQWMGQQAFRSNGNSPNGYFRFNVLPSSPALSAGTQTDCILFYSQNGITRSKATNGDAPTATLRFADMTGATEATSDGEAKTLCATIGSGAAAARTATGPGCLLNRRSTTVARNVITASGTITALASNGDATHVELWCGTASDTSAMDYVATVVPDSAPSKISASFSTPEDNGEVTYYFQWRLFDIGAGGVTNYTDVTDVFNATTKDTTTYTWQAVNGDWDGDWHDTAHWTSDLPSAYGYPRTGNSTAVFPAGQAITVTISENETVGTLDLTANKNLENAATACGVAVTFKGTAETGTNKVLTVSSLFNVKSALGTVTLDNAAIKVSNGNTEPQTGKTIRLVNGANFHGQSLILYEGSVFAVSGKSAASINGFYIGNTGSALSIDDSRVTIRGEANFSAKSTGGTFVFKGENPVLYFGANTKSLQFVVNNAPRFILEVPAGGFAAPIISCASNDANNLFDRNGKTTGTVTFSIAGGSPFYSTVGALDVPLIAWTGTSSSKIDTSNVVYDELPNGGYFMLGASATEDYGFGNAASFSGTAKSMGVHLVSVAHDGKLDIATDAPFEFDGYSPVLGSGTAAAGDSVTATAPASYAADGVRYICTGYTLTEFAAGTAATVSGTPVEGVGSSVTFNMPAGGAKVEWHYATDYAVAATAVNDAGGTVAKSADYVSSSVSVTLTASTTTPGMEFQYWYGDVPYESRYMNPLVISGDAAKNITAFFGATAANGGVCQASGYNDKKDWFDTATWAGGRIPGTNDTAVLVSTYGWGTQSANKARFFVPSFFAVRDLVVSNALVLVAAKRTENDVADASADQNGFYAYKNSNSDDPWRTESVGFDVSGDVVLRCYTKVEAGYGGAIFVGGAQQRCFSKVNIGGDLVIEHGGLEISAGYPLDFVPDASKAIDGPGGFLPFNDETALFRGGNFLKVGGNVTLLPTTANVRAILQVVNDFRTGAAVWLDVAGDVTVGEGSAITAYSGGYGKFNAEGVADGRSYSMCPGGHGTGDNTSGGSHGGLGGSETVNPAVQTPTTHIGTYGYEYFPIHPGSCNSGDTGLGKRGGGSIRLDCATLDLDGALTANGGNAGGNKGAGAGGSVFVICDTLDAGANCAIAAEGGAPTGENSGGGGGRILVCEGLTAAQIAALQETKAPPAGVATANLADKFGTRASAAARVATTTRSCGYDGTAWYMVNTEGRRTLTVAGDPDNLGTPDPDYGPQVFDDNAEIEIAAPADTYITDDNRTRRRAVGYTLADTATGSVIAEKSVTRDTIALAGDWTLTWNLTELQHKLELGAATTGGTLVTNAIGAADELWQNDGTALSVTALPASGFRFAGWTGEIAEGTQYAATFATNVTGGLDVRAVFVSDAAGMATWTGEGDGTSFLDAANWSIGKVPGPQNDVVIAAGASVSVTGLVLNVKSLEIAAGASLAIVPEGGYSTRTADPHRSPGSVALADVHDCGLVASGDIVVNGTLVAGRADSLADARIAAGGTFTIGEGASVTIYGGFNDALVNATMSPSLWRDYGAVASAGGAMTVNGTLALNGERLSGSPVKVAAKSLAVGATGVVHADQGGWARDYIDGVNTDYAPGGQNGGSYNGGAYGGFGGGYNNPKDYGNKRTYGDALRPYLPGSPGGNWSEIRGGGALRIEVEGSLRNNGVISANGSTGGGASGGGSGGSVWISCGKFINGDGAALLAQGGGNTGGGGCGGGGRILVCENLTAEQVDALYATGVAPRKVTATEVTDANASEVFAGIVSAAGGTNVNYSASNSYWSGTAGSIWRLAGKATKFIIVVR